MKYLRILRLCQIKVIMVFVRRRTLTLLLNCPLLPSSSHSLPSVIKDKHYFESCIYHLNLFLYFTTGNPFLLWNYEHILYFPLKNCVLLPFEFKPLFRLQFIFFTHRELRRQGARGRAHPVSVGCSVSSVLSSGSLVSLSAPHRDHSIFLCRSSTHSLAIYPDS